MGRQRLAFDKYLTAYCDSLCNKHIGYPIYAQIVGATGLQKYMYVLA